jgi:DNA recombination protein RmuC
MLALIAVILAAFGGILLGFSLRNASAKVEKAQAEGRNAGLIAELAVSRGNLARAQAESIDKAGFESLSAEREKIIGQLAAERDELRQQLEAKTGIQSQSAARIKELETELRNERQNLDEKLALLDSARQALANQFEALAAGILEKKSQSFSEGSQKELGTLLAPLREQIKEFREKVEQAQSDSKTGVTRLETLIGSLSGLNQQLTEEARHLTTALRGSAKAQGDWGEFILRDLLEKAGLHEGEQYSFQQSFLAVEEEGNGKARSPRTDVIVFLPGGRNLVIDSKVSLKAYTDSVNAETEEQRKTALGEHLKSMRRHITGLAKAGYHNLPGVETPDFVVLFVPVEPAFLLALQSDAELWADAYKQGILLVGPTTLLYIIRIVNVLWQQELQARNVKEVMDRGARLYEKFAGFVEDMDALGKSLYTASQSFEGARKKLSEGDGNLVRQVEMLRQLGVKPKSKKSIPQKWITTADTEEPLLELAAEAEESGKAV